MKFSDKVYYLRSQKKLTQTELAERAHLTQSTIQAYESGRAKPLYNTMTALANALEVDVDDLMNDEKNITE